MAWQDRFLKYFGPGWLSGITFGDWLKLLAENRFRINPRYLGRAATVTGLSAANSLLRWIETVTQGHRIRRQPVPAPLFIVGHWRSGTTHLHKLLCVDNRFTGPTLYEVLFPHWFLSLKLQRLVDLFVPETRWLDNVAVSSSTPAEDEFALAQLTRLSPTIAFAFPRTGRRYNRYLSFHQASDAERQRWQKAFIWLVKKLHAADRRLLVLKSPEHTARIRLILETFPDARFVHIRRDPWRVFQSCRNNASVLGPYNCLQRLRGQQVENAIISTYKTVYTCFLEERGLIPNGQFWETSYERVLENPLREMQAVYESLGLPDFEYVRVPLCDYLATVADYRTNRYDDIPVHLRDRILREWRHVFDEWDYPRTPNSSTSNLGYRAHRRGADATDPLEQQVKNAGG